MKKKIVQIPQLVQTECGLCCITMISRYYGNNISLNDLRVHMEPGRDGVSMKAMINMLEQLKFESKAYRLDADNISMLSTPAIIYWENKHYVILEKIKNKKIMIMDPALGRVSMFLDEFKEKYSGIAISAKPRDDFELKDQEQNVWFYYLPLVLKRKNLLMTILMISTLMYGFNLLIPILTQKLIDCSGNLTNQILIGMGFVLLSFIGITIFGGIKKVLFKTKMFSDFTKDVYKHLISLPYSFFEMRSYGNLLFSLESIGIVKNLYSEKIINFFIDSGAVIIMFGYLFFKSPIIAGLMAILLIGVGFTLKLISQKILVLNQIEISSLSKLQALQVELIYSMQNIKIAGIGSSVEKNWEELFDYTLDKTQKRDISQSYYSSISTIIQIVLPMAVLAISLSLHRSGAYSLGESISFYAIVNTICMYSIGIFTTLNYIELSSQYLERVKDISEQESESNGNIIVPKNFEGDIVLENVRFRYSKNSPYVLDNINLRVKFGEKVAIVGQSGSGKSTLSKIMLGLYEPTSGMVCYGNDRLENLEKSSLRSLIGVVPQETTLFNKTIFENITMGRSDVGIEEVVEACKIAQIHDEINAMPMNYNTLISDMGMNISGGQRQRIVLARSLVLKPRIILFDEATSSLDSLNEKNISEYLVNNGCTQIVIAHRMSTIKDADKIIVLDEGKIVEIGNHESLMRKQGKYAELYGVSSKVA